MKTTFLSIFSILSFISSFPQLKLSSFSIFPNAKEIISANKIIRGEVFYYSFNKKGIKDSGLISTFYYNNLGDLNEAIFSETKKNNQSKRLYTNFYNAKGKLQKQVVKNEPVKMTSITEYDYDTSGNEITKYQYNEDTTLLTIEKKIYNTNNEVIQLATKINNNDFYISRRYSYNSDNELSVIEALNDKGAVIYSYVYEYDKPLNKKTVFLVNDNGKEKIEEYYYNNNNQCIKLIRLVRLPTFMGKPVRENNLSTQVTHIMYNSDKTIFELNHYIDSKKVQMLRHFYFKD